MQLGIVGLPFSGKSTLFQAITKTHLDAAAAAKSDTHLGVVKVPDERLDRCSALFKPKSTVYATIEFVDVAGLNKGASGTAQFTSGFLAAVKNNDALIQVVRLFGDDADPLRTGLSNVFAGIDDYVYVIDPITSSERSDGSITNDLVDVAVALSHGLKHYAAGRKLEALWWWQFSCLSHWGDRAMMSTTSPRSRSKRIRARSYGVHCLRMVR